MGNSNEYSYAHRAIHNQLMFELSAPERALQIALATNYKSDDKLQKEGPGPAENFGFLEHDLSSAPIQLVNNAIDLGLSRNDACEVTIGRLKEAISIIQAQQVIA